MKREIIYNIDKDYSSINEYLKILNYPKSIFVYLRKTVDTALINGVSHKLYSPLKAGDTLTIIINEKKETEIIPVKPPFSFKEIILYEDEDILVLNKPYNLPIHPSINHYNDTLANYTAHFYTSKGVQFVFRCINRLDKDTSGATIIAKNMLSASLLSKQVKDKSLKRTYLAIVEGIPPKKGIIDAPIGRTSDSIITRQIDYINGQHAITNYKTIITRNTNSLVELTLETGRTHQIRVHMKHINHPIIGDYLYYPNFSLINRQALHSYKLEFSHPITKQKMSIIAPLPNDMKQIIDTSNHII